MHHSSKNRAVMAMLALVCLAAPAGAQHQHGMKARPGERTVAPGPRDEFGTLMNDAMKTMDANMRNASMNGDPDHDFAAMMIPHHQGAIDMAKAVLLYGRNPVLRRLAQEIIVTQGSEIAVMQAELNRSSLQSHSSQPRSR